jgi:REP element-mobilizing transposase RayT
MYHLVFPVKYRRSIIGEEIENTLREVCIGIEERYDIHFLEIGMEADHVHFLVQGVPCMAVSRIVTILKSITAKEVFRRHPEVKNMLWGGAFWTSGYYANTVGQYANENVIKEYVKNRVVSTKNF